MIFRSPWPDIEIPDQSLSDFVFANSVRLAGEIAFIDGSSGRTMTHGQIHEGARRVASALVRRGLRKGDVFAILLPNGPEYPLAFHGVAMAGGVVTTASPLSTAEGLAIQLDDSRARFLLTAPALLDMALKAAVSTRVEEVFVLGEAEGATPFAELLAGDAAPVSVDIDPALDLSAHFLETEQLPVPFDPVKLFSRSAPRATEESISFWASLKGWVCSSSRLPMM